MAALLIATELADHVCDCSVIIGAQDAHSDAPGSNLAALNLTSWYVSRFLLNLPPRLPFQKKVT
jgi:hypothetical protein